MSWLPRAGVIAVAGVLACTSLDDHFGPGFILREATYPEAWRGPGPMTGRQALGFALGSLERRGVREVRFCRIDWVAAPLGAVVVYATGRWGHGGAHFESFGLVIYDGTEIKYGHPAGEESQVLARGIDQHGMETWYFSSTKGRDPRVLHLDDLDEVDRDLLFELISREVLVGLPATCGPAPEKMSSLRRVPSFFAASNAPTPHPAFGHLHPVRGPFAETRFSTSRTRRFTRWTCMPVRNWRLVSRVACSKQIS